jgi:thiol-disulfide isomerase/thioredoxin
MSSVTRIVAIGAGILVLTGIIGFGLARRLAAPAPAQASTLLAALSPGAGVRVRLSDKPLALPAMSLRDLDGKPISPSDWRGKVVLLNFWATWCGPCRAEIPMLVALQTHYQDHLVVVGLSIDEAPVETVREFVRGHDVNYPVAIVGEDVQRAFGGIGSVPLTFVVKPDGGIVQRHVGLLNGPLTEHEVRALAGLPTDATVEIVADVGQVLDANAAYATEIPGVSLDRLSSRQKAEALNKLNTEHCNCGCGLTLALCRIKDPACNVSLPLAQKLVAAIGGR